MLSVPMTTTAPSRPAPRAAAVSDDVAALRPLVCAVVAAMLRTSPGHADVDDAASETLRRALEGRSRLRPGEALRPWIVGIAKHVAMDMLRARARTAPPPPPHEGDSTPDLTERVPDSSPSPFERVARAEDAVRVRKALDRLPPSMRAALWLFHADGKSYAEIAKELDVPVGTVATWILRARRALAEHHTEGSTP